MANLHETKKMVRGILERCPETRDNDDLLYLRVIRRYSADHLTLNEFFTSRAALGIPSFETVRRSRQKVQEENPALKGKRVEERAEAEEAFRDFAKN